MTARTTTRTIIAETRLGSGMRQIELILGQDRYDGDVQVAFSVNGKAVGGVQSVAAIQSAGEGHSFILRGDWIGDPAVSVTFLNDGWNGSTGNGNDRNLYVNQVSSDGVVVSDAVRTVLWNGPSYFATGAGRRSAEFADSIGVTTHLLYDDTSYKDEDLVLRSLAYLGINNVRDGGSMLSPAALLPFETAMRAGIRFNFTSSPNDGVLFELDRLRTLVKMNPAGIVSVEGVNEATDAFRYGGQTGTAAALAFQQALYAGIKADPLLSNLPVLNYTILSQDPDDLARFGNVSNTADYGNVHLYAFGGMSGLTGSLLPRLLMGTPSSMGFVVTEMGYDTMSNGEVVSAKYLLDGLFDLALAGATRTYLYELLDEFADPGMTDTEQHFGLFAADGSPKLAATALHNTLAIMRDDGRDALTFRPAPLAYSASNLPETGSTMLFARSDGSFNLVVWAEPLLRASRSSNQEVIAPTVPVQVALGSRAASIDVFDPLLGTSPIAHYAAADQLTINITDHPLILTIRPATIDHVTSTPDPLFDAAFYGTNASVTPAITASYQHYMETGWKMGLDPSAYFSTSFYLAWNTDVAAAGVNPLEHFELHGWREGRDPSQLFSTNAYLRLYPDVERAGMNPLLHYVAYGLGEGRTALPSGTAWPSGTATPLDALVDAGYLRTQTTGAGANAIQWFMQAGWKQSANPNPMFDTRFYLASNPDVAAAGINPLEHYEAFGWHENRDPSLMFSTASYLRGYADVAAAGMNPLMHFLEYGHAEGRDPLMVTGTADRLVDVAFYDQQRGATLIPTGASAAVAATAHYHGAGWKAGLAPNAWFDAAYYLGHGGSMTAARDPLLDFGTAGWKAGLNPSASFSTGAYLAHNPDVAAAGMNPLEHYVVYGALEGRAIYPA